MKSFEGCEGAVIIVEVSYRVIDPSCGRGYFGVGSGHSCGKILPAGPGLTCGCLIGERNNVCVIGVVLSAYDFAVNLIGEGVGLCAVSSGVNNTLCGNVNSFAVRDEGAVVAGPAGEGLACYFGSSGNLKGVAVGLSAGLNGGAVDILECEGVGVSGLCGVVISAFRVHYEVGRSPC